MFVVTHSICSENSEIECLGTWYKLAAKIRSLSYTLYHYHRNPLLLFYIHLTIPNIPTIYSTMSFTAQSLRSSTADIQQSTINKVTADLNTLITECKTLESYFDHFDAEVRQNMRDKCTSIENGLALIEIIYEAAGITDDWWTERETGGRPLWLRNSMHELRRISREITRLSGMFDRRLVDWWNSAEAM